MQALVSHWSLSVTLHPALSAVCVLPYRCYAGHEAKEHHSGGTFILWGVPSASCPGAGASSGMVYYTSSFSGKFASVQCMKCRSCREVRDIW